MVDFGLMVFNSFDSNLKIKWHYHNSVFFLYNSTFDLNTDTVARYNAKTILPPVVAIINSNSERLLKWFWKWLKAVDHFDQALAVFVNIVCFTLFVIPLLQVGRLRISVVEVETFKR